MKDTHFIASELKRLLFEFYATFFPQSAPLGLPGLATDYDPLRLLSIDDIEPIIGTLMGLKSTIPIEWQFGKFISMNSSELLTTRIISSVDIRDALDIGRQTQQLRSNFMIVLHTPQKGGLVVRLKTAEAEIPSVGFMFRSFIALHLNYVFNFYEASQQQHKLELKADTFEELIERINEKIDFIDIDFYDDEIVFSYPHDVLNYKLPDSAQRLRSILSLELKRKSINIPVIRTWIDKIKYHIRSSQRFDASLETICEELRVERRTLSRLLRKEGTTFTDILKELRREKAIRLVINMDIPLKTVATELGFKSDASFNMAFKSWTGMTPMVFRKFGSGSIN